MYPVFEIEWKGPYDSPTKTNKANILYLITGSKIKGPHVNKIRYIGKTTSTAEGRFNPQHNYWKVFDKERKFWIGSIKGSNSASKTASALSKAEWLLVHYLYEYGNPKKIELMNKCLLHEPKYKCFGVVNRWFNNKTNKEYTNYIFPFKAFPDIILWDKIRGHVISADRILIDRDDEQE